jgi:hypothetical protein
VGAAVGAAVAVAPIAAVAPVAPVAPDGDEESSFVSDAKAKTRATSAIATTIASAPVGRRQLGGGARRVRAA